MKKSRSVEKLLGAYPSDVQALAQRARGLLLKLLPGVQEGASSSAPVIAYGYGPGYRGLVCTLILSKSGVKLGLVRGSELADPNGLLEGSGKVHRFIPLRAPADLRRRGVNELIEQTYAAWRTRNA